MRESKPWKIMLRGPKLKTLSIEGVNGSVILEIDGSGFDPQDLEYLGHMVSVANAWEDIVEENLSLQAEVSRLRKELSRLRKELNEARLEVD